MPRTENVDWKLSRDTYIYTYIHTYIKKIKCQNQDKYRK